MATDEQTEVEEVSGADRPEVLVSEEVDPLVQAQERIEELEEELARFRVGSRAVARGTEFAADGAIRIIAGKELKESFLKWVEAFNTPGRHRLPESETADVLAALARRFIRVGTVGLMVALIPSLLLISQSWMMLQQNRLLGVAHCTPPAETANSDW